MANQERDDEIDAKMFFHGHTAEMLEHADHFGGVDYRSADRVTAMEVTTVTSEDRKASQTRRGTLINSRTPAPGSHTCWLVTIDERHPKIKGVERRLLDALIDLEVASVTDYWSRSAYTLGSQNPALRSAVQTLASEKVEHAEQTPEVCQREGTSHEHGVLWATSGGYVASGSDAALTELEGTLNDKLDNFRKLDDSGAERRILYVWVDDETDGSITRPLRDAIGDRMNHFGLPTRAPVLNGTIEELWIVHRRTRRGWRWAQNTWTAIAG